MYYNWCSKTDSISLSECGDFKDTYEIYKMKV